MLHILLAILKCIGIVLAAILGILVLLICIVLFVPMRYKLEAQCDGTRSGLEGEARVSWLCHLVSGYAVYRDEEFSWQMRIFWKKLNVEKPVKAEPAATTEKVQVAQQVSRQKGPKFTDENPKVRKESWDETEMNEKKYVFQKIKCTFQMICDKIKLLLEKKEKLEEFISDTVHRSAFSRLKQEIIRLGRFLRPKKIQMNLHFGFEDPYHTGRVLALLSMLYPFYGEYMNVNPDFEEKILEGDLFIKGHIHGIYAVILVWNLFFDKNIRTAYEHIKAFEL